jgi:hypothetical protein
MSGGTAIAMCDDGGHHTFLICHGCVRCFLLVVEVVNLLRHCWAAAGGVGACPSASMKKCGGPRVSLASRHLLAELLSFGRPCRRTPLGYSCLYIVESDGIRSNVPKFFLQFIGFRMERRGTLLSTSIMRNVFFVLW